MGKTYRVGMIGCGRRAHHHGIGLLAEERAEVVALCDIKPEAARSLNEEFGFGAALYVDDMEMVRRERPDLVVAFLWTLLHLPVFRDCVGAGVRGYLQVGGPDMDLWGGVRIIGSDGFLELTWPGECKRAVVYSDAGWQMPETSHHERPAMERVIRNAVDCMETGEEPVLSWKKALRASEIIYGLYESARRRARVELPLAIRDHPFVSMLEAGAWNTTA